MYLCWWVRLVNHHDNGRNCLHRGGLCLLRIYSSDEERIRVACREKSCSKLLETTFVFFSKKQAVPKTCISLRTFNDCEPGDLCPWKKEDDGIVLRYGRVKYMREDIRSHSVTENYQTLAVIRAHYAIASCGHASSRWGTPGYSKQ